jgi:hypothetical protein
MNEMVERVARAICAASATLDWREYQDEAHAAIAAMREPTDTMAKIGDNYTNCGGPCGNRMGRRAWCAMIDSALRD